ncbi:glycosyltransferase family 4 protein [Phocaeicola plebeius]|uniref:glycosyltransferase family 4 protein n=1 Tax=Phocaeicola plebeius TaxID=310297 RepID=UPI0040279873
MKYIIVSPSLDPTQNVSGISAVTQFIIENNKSIKYIHFELGKKDNEKGGINRIYTILKNIISWNKLLNNNPDAYIHYNFPLSKSSILRDPIFMWIARKKGHKIVIHLHGGLFLTAPRIPFYLNIILKRIFQWNVTFIVLSKIEQQLIKNRYNCKIIEILPNCINLNEAKKYNKTINNKTNNPLIIGYLGRIVNTKGMDYLLKACKNLKESNIPFILKLAGKEDGNTNYIESFKKILGNQFIYAGVVSGYQKDIFLKSLDLFILPTFFEGLPMSLLECMSYGVVPITTNVGSINEVVEDNVNGIFIKVKDSDSIYEKIMYIQNNRNLIENLSIKAKETIFQKFSPIKYIENLNFIYKQLK